MPEGSGNRGTKFKSGSSSAATRHSKSSSASPAQRSGSQVRGSVARDSAPRDPSSRSARVDRSAAPARAGGRDGSTRAARAPRSISKKVTPGAGNLMRLFTGLLALQSASAPSVSKPSVQRRSTGSSSGQDGFAFPSDSNSTSVYQAGSYVEGSTSPLTFSGFAGPAPINAFQSFINSAGGVTYNPANSSVSFDYDGFNYQFGGFSRNSSGLFEYNPSFSDSNFRRFYGEDTSKQILNVRVIDQSGSTLNYKQAQDKLAELDTAISRTDVVIPPSTRLVSDISGQRVFLSDLSRFDTSNALNSFYVAGEGGIIDADNYNDGTLSYVDSGNEYDVFALGPNLISPDGSQMYAVANGVGNTSKIYQIYNDPDNDQLDTSSIEGDRSMEIRRAPQTAFIYGIRNPDQHSLVLGSDGANFISAAGRDSFAGISITRNAGRSYLNSYKRLVSGKDVGSSMNIAITAPDGSAVSTIYTASSQSRFVQGPNGASFFLGRYRTSSGAKNYGVAQIDSTSSNVQIQNLATSSDRTYLQTSGDDLVRFKDSEGNFYYQTTVNEAIKITVDGTVSVIDQSQFLPMMQSLASDNVNPNLVTLNSGDVINLNSNSGSIFVTTPSASITHQKDVGVANSNTVNDAYSVGLVEAIDVNIDPNRSLVVSFQNEAAQESSFNIHNIDSNPADIEWKLVDRSLYSPYDIAGSSAVDKFDNLEASLANFDIDTFNPNDYDDDRYFIAGRLLGTNSVVTFDTGLDLAVAKARGTNVVLESQTTIAPTTQGELTTVSRRTVNPATGRSTEAVTQTTVNPVTQVRNETTSEVTTDNTTGVRTETVSRTTVNPATGRSTEAVTQTTVNPVTQVRNETTSEVTTDNTTGVRTETVSRTTVSPATGRSTEAVTQTTVNPVTQVRNETTSEATTDNTTGVRTEIVSTTTVDPATDSVTQSSNTRTIDPVSNTTEQQATYSSVQITTQAPITRSSVRTFSSPSPTSDAISTEITDNTTGATQSVESTSVPTIEVSTSGNITIATNESTTELITTPSASTLRTRQTTENGDQITISTETRIPTTESPLTETRSITTINNTNTNEVSTVSIPSTNGSYTHEINTVDHSTEGEGPTSRVISTQAPMTHYTTIPSVSSGITETSAVQTTLVPATSTTPQIQAGTSTPGAATSGLTPEPSTSGQAPSSTRAASVSSAPATSSGVQSTTRGATSTPIQAGTSTPGAATGGLTPEPPTSGQAPSSTRAASVSSAPATSSGVQSTTRGATSTPIQAGTSTPGAATGGLTPEPSTSGQTPSSTRAASVSSAPATSSGVQSTTRGATSTPNTTTTGLAQEPTASGPTSSGMQPTASVPTTGSSASTPSTPHEQTPQGGTPSVTPTSGPTDPGSTPNNEREGSSKTVAIVIGVSLLVLAIAYAIHRKRNQNLKRARVGVDNGHEMDDLNEGGGQDGQGHDAVLNTQENQVDIGAQRPLDEDGAGSVGLEETAFSAEERTLTAIPKPEGGAQNQVKKVPEPPTSMKNVRITSASAMDPFVPIGGGILNREGRVSPRVGISTPDAIRPIRTATAKPQPQKVPQQLPGGAIPGQAINLELNPKGTLPLPNIIRGGIGRGRNKVSPALPGQLSNQPPRGPAPANRKIPPRPGQATGGQPRFSPPGSAAGDARPPAGRKMPFQAGSTARKGPRPGQATGGQPRFSPPGSAAGDARPPAGRKMPFQAGSTARKGPRPGQATGGQPRFSPPGSAAGDARPPAGRKMPFQAGSTARKGPRPGQATGGQPRFSPPGSKAKEARLTAGRKMTPPRIPESPAKKNLSGMVRPKTTKGTVTGRRNESPMVSPGKVPEPATGIGAATGKEKSNSSETTI